MSVTGFGDITLTAGADATNRGTKAVCITVTTNNVNCFFNPHITAADGIITLAISGNTKKVLLQDATSPDRRSRIVITGNGSLAYGTGDSAFIESNDTTNALQIIAATGLTIGAGQTAAIGNDAITQWAAVVGGTPDVSYTDADLNTGNELTINGTGSAAILLDMIALFTGPSLTLTGGSTVDGANQGFSLAHGSAGSLTLSSGGAIGTTYFPLVLDLNTISIPTTGGANSISITDQNTSNTTYNIGGTLAAGAVTINRATAGNIVLGTLSSSSVNIGHTGGGSITDTGTLTISGNSIFATTDADIILDSALNTFGNLTLTVNDGAGGNTTRDGDITIV